MRCNNQFGSRSTRRVGCLLGVGVMVLTGCAMTPANTATTQTAEPQKSAQQVAEMLDPNVVGVAALYDSYDPWLWTESRSKPIGVVIRALYLQGTQYKGVFGDGIIKPKLYVQELTPAGERDWKLAKEWTFTVEEAMPFRSKRQTMLGWGYRFHLPWGDLNVAGREIRMVVEFQRTDGRSVVSDKKDFRVPGAVTGQESTQAR